MGGEQSEKRLASDLEIDRIVCQFETDLRGGKIRRIEEIMLGDGKRADGQTPGGPAPDRRAGRGPGGLPSEQDIDQAVDYLERMFKKFRDNMKDLDGGSGRGTPL